MIREGEFKKGRCILIGKLEKKYIAEYLILSDYTNAKSCSFEWYPRK
jgi:hypothetical protein